ncbi:hypothetical protein [Oceanicola sp. S124]|uniref:hypothetical protein n=1 Tax=Oceanicola sp. S124 TaxID=1042378 RepID=UPI00110FF412|nr:hypothetical protein [Oceanicola sp. S124]
MTESIEDAARKCLVTGIQIFAPGSPVARLYRGDLEGRDDETAAPWYVKVGTRTGYLPETSFVAAFSNEQEATAFANRYPLGSEVPGEEGAFSLFAREMTRQEFVRQAMCGDVLFSRFLTVGDEDLRLPFSILAASSVTDEAGLRPSQLVLDSLGKERTQELQLQFGANWAAAAEYEYCWVNLPQTSPVYIAAACRYHYFITGEAFSAGYLLRDLEVLEAGIEVEASKAMARRRNAGAKGSESSSRARRKRRAALMDALEKVAAENPAIAPILGPKDLLTVALPEAKSANPTLWAQGEGQARDYLDEIRRGEAGSSLKERYHQLFPAKTA